MAVADGASQSPVTQVMPNIRRRFSDGDLRYIVNDLLKQILAPVPFDANLMRAEPEITVSIYVIVMRTNGDRIKIIANLLQNQKRIAISTKMVMPKL
jgi:hypothetical protein